MGEVVRRFLLVAFELLRLLADVVELAARGAVSFGIATRSAREGRPDGKCDRGQTQKQDEDFPEAHFRRVAPRRRGGKKVESCGE